MAVQGVAQKLRISRDSTLLLLNAPQGYQQLFGVLPDGVRVATEPAGQHDVVLLFVRDRAELERSLRQATEAVREGGALWIAWEKRARRGPNDLNRDSLWAIVQPSGWGPVTNVAIDEAWSALRFKPESEIKRGER
ncbi:MAG TPA: hypothetical protein VF510_05200 [Ktedonobacterales bacterium]